MSLFDRIRAFRAWALLLASLLVLASGLVAGDSKWYLQGKLGGIDLDTRFGGTESIHDEDTSRSVEVGYSAVRHLGFQVGVTDLGEHVGGGSICPQDAQICAAVVAPLRAELTGLSLAAVPRWPFTERWSAFGKLGVIDWQSDVSVDGAGFDRRRIESFDDREFLTGVGAQYDFPAGLGLLVEHQRFDLVGGWTALGASWRF